MNGTVAAVGAGQAHVCALKSGVVYCWGRDDFGELGRGTGNQTTHVPTALSIPGTVSHLWVGYSSNCAKNTSNHTYCWGYNGNGIIDAAVSGNVETPTRVSALDSATKIDFGQHICGLVGGVVKCRGSNLAGGLGTSQPTTTSSTTWQNVPMFSTASSAIDLSVSYEGHTCVVRTGGQVFCFGRDSFGQLGASAPIRRATRTLAADWSGSGYASQLIDSPFTTCGLVSGGVKCAGSNLYSMVSTIATDLITPFPITVRSLTSGVTAVGGNAYANCALVSGAVKCWGLAGYNGTGGSATEANPATVSGLSSGVTSLHSGPYTTCAIKSGKAYCWGWNSYAAMGNGTAIALVSTPIEVTISGKSITDVSIGMYHICVLAGGGIYCSGRNAEGLLGNGTTTASSVFVAVPGHSSGYTALAASYYGQCALKSNGDLYCWGNSRENGTSGSDVLVPTLVKTNILTDADRLLCFGYFSNNEYPIGTTGCSAGGMFCNIPTAHTEINALGKIIDVNVGYQRVCGRASASNTSWSCTGTDTNSSMGTGATSVLFTPVSASPF
jgi:alpha-tubulin suppressor-like RCC1 family protein